MVCVAWQKCGPGNSLTLPFSRVILNPGEVGHHGVGGGSCGEELSTLAQGGTARSDSPQGDINLMPLKFTTMQMHTSEVYRKTRLDNYIVIRVTLYKLLYS